ncbi:DUF262 domain-containing protein [Bifidobacterium sp. ESL0745]|uniref:DUF262 domain-containing protein n=1 Tax=Bifidobacterium sp. ESL0745 TaxID=2983226 RepID=UPI0023F756A7|nr:DUF262 domain-containing protein [Bifidobacterium sp. ESL0745]MDF7665173.1 DUF262 domain-containing protein [Bifidobacterium sp. ESL0745]
MSKLNIDQKSIRELLTNKRTDFLIPDYQRPYAWGEDECATLWDDLFAFAFPNDDCDQFDANDEYFLGPIVTFKNQNNQLEIIDGQQRLTTIMLLLRAFYDKFANMKDKPSTKMHSDIACCVWKTNEFDEPDMTRLKIDSEVASDNDKNEFLQILRTGMVELGWTSNYAKNFSYFQERISQLVNSAPTYLAIFATRIIRNVILLPIEAESQDTALRIFSTLNDRGLPLSDADIFKSQFYKYFSSEGMKDSFVQRWKVLEDGASSVFTPLRGTPMDELFTRYMYFRRAKMGIRDTTTQSLRDFFSRDSYAMLKSDETLSDLEALLGFWQQVDTQDGFSDRVLRCLFVLSYAPNGMWTYLLSVWFLANRDENNELDEESLYNFLNVIIAFIYAYSIERPGVNALRSPVYPEMINIVNHSPVTFSNYQFTRDEITNRFHAYVFTNGRPITKSMLTWWAYSDPQQSLLSMDTKLEIEHIYAKKRNELTPLADQANLDSLGNKALLEKRINIRASDYRFADKRKYYTGFTDAHNRPHAGTNIHELQDFAAQKDDFTEDDITTRTSKIIDSFVNYLGDNGLIKE